MNGGLRPQKSPKSRTQEDRSPMFTNEPEATPDTSFALAGASAGLGPGLTTASPAKPRPREKLAGQLRHAPSIDP
jgi:hypothetical protein